MTLLDELVSKKDEMRRLLRNFPSPRDQPVEAIEAKDRIRQLKAEIDQCLEELSAHALHLDVQN